VQSIHSIGGSSQSIDLKGKALNATIEGFFLFSSFNYTA
jgi:hypothetical protein